MRNGRFLLAYCALALFVAFFPAFSGELPVPASSVLGLLPDGPPPPETNELSDVPTQFLPWSRAVADAYRSRRLPFRFASNGSGTPLWGNPQAQAVTPTTLFYLFLPEAWASAAAAAAKLVLGAAGAFLFLRARGCSELAAGWGGFAYGFSLSAATWMHFPHSYPYALLPWALGALERLARRRPGGFRATLVVVFLLLSGGYPEGELYVSVAGAIFFAVLLFHERVRARERFRRATLALAAALLAAGLSAAFTVPAFLAVARGERSVQASRFPPPPASLSLADFVRLPLYWEAARFWVVPEAQGNPRDEDKFGPYSFAGRTSGYAGILVAALALGSFFWWRAPRSIVWVRWAVLFLALYVTWYRPLRFFFESVPGVREVSIRLTTNRATAIALLLLGFLAAWMLDRLRDGADPAPARWAAAMVLLALLLVFAEYAGTPGRPALTLWRATRFVLPLLLLLGVLACLFARVERRRGALAGLLLIGTGVDLLRLDARFNPGTAPEHYYPVTPAVRELQRVSAGGRFASSRIAFTGVSYMYGLEDVAVHDPVAPADYEEVLGLAAGYTGPADYLARVARLDAPLLDFLNVRARLGSSRQGADRVVATAPASLPERLVGARSRGELLEFLGRETDFAGRALIVGPSESFPGKAEVLYVERPSPEEIRLRVRAGAPRLLALPETNDGGWTAEADGKRCPTLVVNGAFLGVRIPAGETTVLCRYTPPGFRAGLGLTVFSVLILVGLAVCRRVRGTTTAPGLVNVVGRGARSSSRNR